MRSHAQRSPAAQSSSTRVKKLGRRGAQPVSVTVATSTILTNMPRDVRLGVLPGNCRADPGLARPGTPWRE